jgi:hypothetical protein
MNVQKESYNPLFFDGQIKTKLANTSDNLASKSTPSQAKESIGVCGKKTSA